MNSKKLVIQIPCFNEADQIAECLSVLPKHVEGFGQVETFIVDDGSSDETIARAKAAGVTHVLKLERHVGLAQAFSRGLEHACMELRADVVVNYDADRQYEAKDIPLLTAPLLRQEADYVLGERPVMAIDHFSPVKKVLQKVGSAFVSFMSGLRVPDVTSGFRAITRDAALKLSVWTQYSYTLETLVHAAECGLVVRSIPIRVAPDVARPSRLVRSMFHYCWTSVRTVLLTAIRYRAFSVFITASIICFTAALIIGTRFLYYFLQGYSGHVQSLILCAILSFAALIFFLGAVLGEGISLNRRLLEQMRYESRLKLLSRPRS